MSRLVKNWIYRFRTEPVLEEPAPVIENVLVSFNHLKFFFDNLILIRAVLDN